MKILYHGSAKKLVGDKLFPKQAKDVDKIKKQNMLKGVYATDIKKTAIIMSILHSNGVKEASLDISNSKGVIYSGSPRQKQTYLYVLPRKNFKRVSNNQFVSIKPVKPLKIEKINVKDYLHFIKRIKKIK